MKPPHYPAMRRLLAALWVAAVFPAATLLVTPGCSRLIEHPKQSVSVPAIVGGTIGGVAGIPLALVALPVTVPITFIAEKRASKAGDHDPFAYMMIPWMPMAPTGYVGTFAVGAPFWCVFGWWGLPKDSSPYYASPRVLWSFTNDHGPENFTQRAARTPVPSPTPAEATP